MQGVAAATLLAFPGFARAATRGGRPSEADIVIRRNPGCQCCHLWVEHLELHGFTVSMEEDQDMQGYKDELGVPADLRSCHTGLVQGYVIEGHVPALDIWQLLGDRPDVRGIAVPGMPIGSPGMEMDDRVDPYEVVAFGGALGRHVFARHG
jgi:hypothetical protein